jgi:hypothetical protein
MATILTNTHANPRNLDSWHASMNPLPNACPRLLVVKTCRACLPSRIMHEPPIYQSQEQDK